MIIPKDMIVYNKSAPARKLKISTRSSNLSSFETKNPDSSESVGSNTIQLMSKG